MDTVFALATPFCDTPSGDGSEANPYCRVQDAVDAAVSGDTVKIIGRSGYSSWWPVVVRTSGISLVGSDDGSAWIYPTNNDSGKQTAEQIYL